MVSLCGLVWLSSEVEGAFNIFKMEEKYKNEVDKDEFPDFLCWLYDMEHSGVFTCHDMTDKMKKPFTVAHDELGNCPVCGGGSYRDDYSLEGSLYIEERCCEECGSTWNDAYKYEDSIITRIGGRA